MSETTKQNPEFVISRVFDAPRELVWKAHTECQHLQHWWGSKGFKMTSCKLDFRPGGTFLYCLSSPAGQQMWGKFVYREIVALEKLVFINSFSDAAAGITRHPMSATWPLEMLNTSTFSEQDGRTTLTIRSTPHNASEEERQTFEAGMSGMEQGFGGTFAQLDEYLKSLRSDNR